MNKILKEQFLAVRATGKTNMLDARMVQMIANDMGFYGLATYLEEHRAEYAHFILTGNVGEEEL